MIKFEDYKLGYKVVQKGLAGNYESFVGTTLQRWAGDPTDCYYPASVAYEENVVTTPNPYCGALSLFLSYRDAVTFLFDTVCYIDYSAHAIMRALYWDVATTAGHGLFVCSKSSLAFARAKVRAVYPQGTIFAQAVLPIATLSAATLLESSTEPWQDSLSPWPRDLYQTKYLQQETGILRRLEAWQQSLHSVMSTLNYECF
jgi:hypothetical protein